jgi:hypothetical protein
MLRNAEGEEMRVITDQVIDGTIDVVAPTAKGDWALIVSYIRGTGQVRRCWWLSPPFRPFPVLTVL